jgi:hypothetical protein
MPLFMKAGDRMETAVVVLSLVAAAFAACAVALSAALMTLWPRVRQLEREAVQLRQDVDKLDAVLDSMLSGGTL